MLQGHAMTAGWLVRHTSPVNNVHVYQMHRATHVGPAPAYRLLLSKSELDVRWVDPLVAFFCIWPDFA